MKKLICKVSALIISLVFIIPLGASAQTFGANAYANADPTSQIQHLRDEINLINEQLKKLINDVNASSSQPTIPPPGITCNGMGSCKGTSTQSWQVDKPIPPGLPQPMGDSSGCPSITRNLSTGSQGSDVSGLQKFLADQGDFNGLPTGYFGAQTKAAVGRWQEENSVTTSGNAGFGSFGPRSRSFFFQSCGGMPTPSQQSFSADPQSGAAPLAVDFSTSDSITSSTTYSVDFGDGQTDTMTKGSCIAITATVGGQGGIRCSYDVTHTYTTNGTYTAHLMKDTCPAGAECFAGPLIAGTISITVGSTGNTTCSADAKLCPDGSYVGRSGPLCTFTCPTTAAISTTFSATPKSGAAPLTVTFVPGSSIGTYAVNFGDGSSASLQQGTISHTYTQAGTYSASFESDAACFHSTPMCGMPQQSYGTVTINVTSATQGGISFTASPTSGVAPLSVYFRSSTGGPIAFGDGNSGTLNEVFPPCAPIPASSCPPYYAISHTYATAGTYMATLLSSSGGVLGRATVTVTSPSSTTQGAPVITSISPTSGPVGTKVTITGTGLNATAPLIQPLVMMVWGGISSGASVDVNSSGTQATFIVPAYDTQSCATGCSAVPTVPLPAGTYQIMYNNGKSTNNTKTFTVTNATQGTANVAFAATPNSGSAPLSVQFIAGGLTANSYVVNFGDGASGTLVLDLACGSTEDCSATINHIYTSAGTYTATLRDSSLNSLKTVSVTVTGSSQQQNVSFSATPASGAAPLPVNFIAGGLTANYSYTINFGDGASGTLTPSCGSLLGCNGAISHTYTTAGTYLATLSYSLASNSLKTVSVTVTASTSTQGAPIISSISPTSGPVGTKVTITGTGLVVTPPSQPIVTMVSSGGGVFALASVSLNTSGTQATFTIPASGYSCTALSGCATAGTPVPLPAGTYQIAFYNIKLNTSSNTKTFTVTP